MAEEDIEFTTLDGDDITKSDIRDEIQEMYLDANTEGYTKITDFSIGSEAYHLIDTLANLMLEHIEMNDDNAKQLLISTAEGEFLDSWGDRVGVHRGNASASEGVVTFSLPIYPLCTKETHRGQATSPRSQSWDSNPSLWESKA